MVGPAQVEFRAVRGAGCEMNERPSGQCPCFPDGVTGRTQNTDRAAQVVECLAVSAEDPQCDATAQQNPGRFGPGDQRQGRAQRGEPAAAVPAVDQRDTQAREHIGFPASRPGRPGQAHRRLQFGGGGVQVAELPEQHSDGLVRH